MSWRVEFSTEAADETRGISPEAFIALMAALGDAAHDPWGASRSQHPDGLQGERRVLTFDTPTGAGMVTYDIVRSLSVLRVYAVTWLD